MRPATMGGFSARSVGVVAGLTIVALLSFVSSSRGQDVECVTLNNDNTDIFTQPDECFTKDEHLIWCNCVNSLLTKPVRGGVTGLSQAVIWVTDQQGIANQRVEVSGGTLDLSGLQVGDVIGGTLTEELVPEILGVPPGTFFRLQSEIRITSVGADLVFFDIVIVEISPFVTEVIDNPLDAAHSGGLFYEGCLESLGPGNGFVLEYRYPKELVGPDQSPAIEVGDAADPGFNARFKLHLISEESGLFTLPDEESLTVNTTLRRFPEDNLGEILPLDDPDFCQVIAQDPPCKFFEENFALDPSSANNPPTAVIVMLDPSNGNTLIPDQGVISTMCETAKIFCVGRNSDDGDGDVQGLAYEWSILSGPDGGASIPDETRNFQDTEITFTIPGDYEIGLLVDDGQAENNTDETVVLVSVEQGFDFNVEPTAVVTTIPDPPQVELDGGVASVQLDGSQSSNGFLDLDDCMQELLFLWSVVDEPTGGNATIAEPMSPTTTATFNAPGEYVIELEVNDQQEEDNTHAVEVIINVTGTVGMVFRRGDDNGDGMVDVSDPITGLGFQFLGQQPPNGLCQDAMDFNDDGKVDVSDPIGSLSHQFLGLDAPPPPGKTTCGEDPTPDDKDPGDPPGGPEDELGCESYPLDKC